MIKCYGFLVLSWSWAFACGCFFLYGRPCRIPCVLSFSASCWLWLRSSLFSSGTIYDSWKRKGIPLKISGIPFLNIWRAPNLIFCCAQYLGFILLSSQISPKFFSCVFSYSVKNFCAVHGAIFACTSSLVSSSIYWIDCWKLTFVPF